MLLSEKYIFNKCFFEIEILEFQMRTAILPKFKQLKPTATQLSEHLVVTRHLNKFEMVNNSVNKQK